MATGKAKSTSTSNGTSKKSKTAAPSDHEAPSPVTPTAQDVPEVTYGSGKPDKAIYDAEQEKIKVEIDALQLKLSAVKDKIGLSGKGGVGNDRRATLRAELETIRSQQSTSKLSRGKVFEQLKSLQDGVQKKIKDLNTARSRIPFKTVTEVDDRIKHLDKQVESGNLKLADEKRALQEISQCKRNRRVVEGFQAEQDAIEADRAAADALRKELDDPEAKATSERYDAIKAELDELKKEGDEAYANRSKLMDERTALQGELDVLFNKKRESNQHFRDANDRYWAKVNEDRARRAERARAQRAADEDAKKKEVVDRLREEASIPAFQAQIEDCQTLIDSFSGKSSGAPSLSTSAEKAEVVGVPKLEIRKVEVPKDLVARKKKGDDEESYFTGGKGGKGRKGKKGGHKAPPSPADSNGPEAGGNDKLNISLAILSALTSLSIPPPTSSSDLPRVVEDLKTKKAWFQANQTRVTGEQKDKAEAEIIRLLGGKTEKTHEPSPTIEVTPPSGDGEKPAEPAPTPATADVPPAGVPTEEVDEKLESVQEHKEAA